MTGPPHGDARRRDLLAALEALTPRSPREHDSRRRALAELGRLDRPFDEHAQDVHVTASAIVRDPAGRVLLHRHRILGCWLQPGGHVEEGEDPATAALREAIEETGVQVRHTYEPPQLAHVDVHPGAKDHCRLHLDVRYLLVAPADAVPAPPDGESQDVRWFTLDEARHVADPGLRDAL